MSKFISLDAKDAKELAYKAPAKGSEQSGSVVGQFTDFALSHMSVASASSATTAASHVPSALVGNTSFGLASSHAAAAEGVRAELAGKPVAQDHDGDIVIYGEANYKTLGGHASPPQLGSHLESTNVAVAEFSAPSSALAGDVDTIPAFFSVSDTLSPDETDAYRFSLVAGETYTFSLYGDGDSPLTDTYLQFYDANETLIAFDDDGGSGVNSLFTFTADTTADYFVQVAAFPGSGLGGDYTLDAILSPGVDVVGDAFDATATELTFGVGNYTYGFIDAGVAGHYGAGFSESDVYSFNAEAGQLYTFEVNGGADLNSDYLNLPDGELDTYILIYDQDGNVVAQNDDINFPDDVSSSVSFFAQEGGTYYLDVFSYAPYTGGYSIESQEVVITDLDPLDAINWVNADNIAPEAGNGNVVYVYFGDSDMNFGQLGDDGNPMVTIDWNDFEKGQVIDALGEFSKILGFDYQITEDLGEATFRLLKTESTQYGAYFYPQDPVYGADQGVGVFNVLSGGFNFDQQQALLQGGFSYATILHEFGHAHGLAHTHDQGGGSDVLLGVSAAQGSYGIYDLNQGIYSVMSYNDAWDFNPIGPSPFTADGVDNGWSGTLSAFDIATLQLRYGVTDFATGDDVYMLRDVQDVGTYYETIWDSGGTDEIAYRGDFNVQIDLLAATLDYTPTGGGVVSFVNGIWGGYTIANGVVIENASGGNGDDVILGNDSANRLEGKGGDDMLFGRDGNDTIFGGSGDDLIAGGRGSDLLRGGRGDDTFEGGFGQDTIIGGSGYDTVSYLNSTGGVSVTLQGGNTYQGIEAFQGSNFRDDLEGSNDGETILGEDGSDVIRGADGFDTIFGGQGNDTVYGNAGDDQVGGGLRDDDVYGGGGNDVLFGNDGRDDLYGNRGDDTLRGGNGDDALRGGAGDDLLFGGDGDDFLNGGIGNDTFAFNEGGLGDQINDFESGSDTIDLSGIDADSTVDGNDAFTFIGDDAFSNQAGELRYEGGFLQGDMDGDGTADLIIRVDGDVLQVTDIVV